MRQGCQASLCLFFFYVCGFFTFFIGLSINIDALDSDFAHFGRLDPSAPGKQCGLCKWLLNSHEDLLTVQTHLIMFLSDCLQLAHQSQETGFRVKRIRQQVFGQGSAVLRCPVWCFHAHADYARWRSHLFRSWDRILLVWDESASTKVYHWQTYMCPPSALPKQAL